MSKSKFLLLLTVFLLISPISDIFTASAAPIIDSGKCGDNLTWTLDSDYVLTINGTGAMYNYHEASNPAPWMHKTVNTVIIGDDVTRIGDKAFFSSPNPRKLIIGKNLSSVGEAAFYLQFNLTEIHIPNLITWLNIDFNDEYASPLYSPQSELYLNNERITELIIPEGIKEIKDYAFYNCLQLQSIKIPASVTEIGEDAFYECTNLKDVYITDIEAWCNIDFDAMRILHNGGILLMVNSNPLKYTENLWLNQELITDLTIPNGVTSVKEAAFYGYDKLESIAFPSGLTEIKNSAFHNCTNLSTIYYAGSAREWSEIKIDIYNTPLTAVKIYTTDNLTPVTDFEADKDHEYVVTYGENIVSGDGVAYDYTQYGAYKVYFSKFVGNTYKKPKAQGITVKYTNKSGNEISVNLVSKTPFRAGEPFGILVFGDIFQNDVTVENYIEY